MRGQNTHIEYSEIPWSALKRLMPFLIIHKKRLSLAFLLLIAAKLATLIMPFILKSIVDHLGVNHSDNITNIKNEAVIVPLALLLAYGGLRLTSVLFAELRDTVFGRITENAMHSIALTVFNHLHQLDLSFHLNRKTGGLSRDIERGITGISFLLRFIIFNIAPTLIEIILVIIILSQQYSLSFGGIVLFAISFYIIWSIWATEIRTKYVREMNKADNNTNTRAIDSLLNYETVKYFNNEKYESDLYDLNLDEWEYARRKNRLSIFALNSGQAAIISISMTAAMILSAYKVSNGEMTLGDFVLINAFMMQIFMPLNFLGFVYREIKGAISNIYQMFNLLEIESKIKNSDDPILIEKNIEDIHFNEVSFHYYEDRTIFNSLSLSIKAGKKTAIIGSSGSGKSTLAKLLFRFYDCTSGSIYIGDHDIRAFDLDSLRKRIACVPQDCILFNTSIYENVRYGRVNASEESILKSIELAHLNEFIKSLPKGLETIVGERGLKLSGGEKQRIAIARAILKDPDIFIFDEATSALDSESEKSILKALSNIGKNKTQVVIAHRLSTIYDADHIIVLEKGAVVEQGSHTNLINKGQRYAELWKLQENEKYD